MSRTCPSCGSERCGNHAACARNAEKQSVERGRVAASQIMWLVVGMAEVLYRQRSAFIAKRGLIAQVLLANSEEHLKRMCVEDALLYIEQQTRERAAR